jgi:hypothetical protein
MRHIRTLQIAIGLLLSTRLITQTNAVSIRDQEEAPIGEVFPNQKKGKNGFELVYGGSCNYLKECSRRFTIIEGSNNQNCAPDETHNSNCKYIQSCKYIDGGKIHTREKYCDDEILWIAGPMRNANYRWCGKKVEICLVNNPEKCVSGVEVRDNSVSNNWEGGPKLFKQLGLAEKIIENGYDAKKRRTSCKTAIKGQEIRITIKRVE